MECVNRVASHVPCKRRNMLRIGQALFPQECQKKRECDGDVNALRRGF